MPLGKVWPTAISETSATYTDLAASLNELRVENGNTYRLVKAGAAIANRLLCMPFTTEIDTDGDDFGLYVTVTGANTSLVVGANTTGGTITSGHYFWMQIDGLCWLTATGDGTMTDGARLMPAADGEALDFVGDAAENCFCGISLEDTSGSDPYYARVLLVTGGHCDYKET